MAFGIKIKSVKTKNAYTLEELYEQIKDKPFTAGTPEYTKHGAAYIITFPALDDHNQVWIIQGGFKQPTNKWSVQKQDRAGLGNLIGNTVAAGLTRGMSDSRGVFGSNVKMCEKLVEETAKELDALGL